MFSPEYWLRGYIDFMTYTTIPFIIVVLVRRVVQWRANTTEEVTASLAQSKLLHCTIFLGYNNSLVWNIAGWR